MNKKEKIQFAAKSILNNQETIESLLDELVNQECIQFDDAGNPYWESCGEPIVEGTELVFE